jgi:hypothetical protein
MQAFKLTLAGRGACSINRRLNRAAAPGARDGDHRRSLLAWAAAVVLAIGQARPGSRAALAMLGAGRAARRRVDVLGSRAARRSWPSAGLAMPTMAARRQHLRPSVASMKQQILSINTLLRLRTKVAS